ncbi:MAG: hypothetical protein JST01_23950 [Cyanobacteria bacterium SZAS TMP-1]|nr:hypothetical protein [Cyanobacteria bacterium SZAS TMP-1]
MPVLHKNLNSRASRPLAFVAALLLAGQLAAGVGAAEARGKTQPKGRAAARATSASPAARAPGAHGSANVALLAQGARLHKEGRIEEAEAIFKEVLIHDPQSVDAFYDLGAIAEGRGDLISALSHYHAALALRPGDKELKEAVASVERALKKNNTEIAGKKAAPTSLAPAVPTEKVAEQIDPVSLPEGPAAAEISAADKSEPGLPVLNIPEADAAPRAVDSKTFQLSSRKAGLIEPATPTLGITQDQFPDIPLNVGLQGGLNGGLNGGRANNCPPTPTLTVGQAPKSHNTQRMRQAASLLLMVGAGAALNASGLHCPVCHMMRLRF